jgi:hypothetical protein
MGAHHSPHHRIEREREVGFGAGRENTHLPAHRLRVEFPIHIHDRIRQVSDGYRVPIGFGMMFHNGELCDINNKHKNIINL